MTFQSDNYGNLDQEFLAAFPELMERYSAEFSYWQKDSQDRPGAYMLFGLVVYPFVTESLDVADQSALKRLFAFFETMARSADPKVLNLLRLEVIDNLLYDPARLGRAWRYMGHFTKRITTDAASKLNLESNLP